MVNKASKWESQLWSYLSTGNGMRCPQFSNCSTRSKGDYCPDADKDDFSQLIDSDGHFDRARFNGVKPCGEGVMQHVESLAEHKFGRGRATDLPIPTNLVELA